MRAGRFIKTMRMTANYRNELLVSLALVALAGCAKQQGLWQDVNAGMTADQLKAIRPAAHKISAKEWENYPMNCNYADNPVTLQNIQFRVCYVMPQGTVERVVLHSGSTDDGTAGNDLKTWLAQKYGGPTSDSCVENALGQECDTVWSNGETAITLLKLDDSKLDRTFSYQVRYSLRRNAENSNL